MNLTKTTKWWGQMPTCLFVCFIPEDLNTLADWEYRLKTGVLSHDSLAYTHINYVVFLLVWMFDNDINKYQ